MVSLPGRKQRKLNQRTKPPGPISVILCLSARLTVLNPPPPLCVSAFLCLSGDRCPTRYNLRRGAVFGLSHGLNQLSLLRPGPQHPTINGLWFCGASGRPGNGVPLVLIGAKKVAENVLKVVAGGNT